jgi:type III secretion system chaperone SycN
MTAPNWIDAAVRDFGRGAGLADFALNAQGAAAVRFENGLSLRFECAGGELVVAVTAPAARTAEAARQILAWAHPDARTGFRVRAGYLAKSGCAVFAVRLAFEDVTLPVLNSVFGALWRVAMEAGGAA